eukprot:7387673-Prymnesium_polylepis.3
MAVSPAGMTLRENLKTRPPGARAVAVVVHTHPLPAQFRPVESQLDLTDLRGSGPHGAAGDGGPRCCTHGMAVDLPYRCLGESLPYWLLEPRV